MLRAINRYQWLVLIACYLGGMFDGLDSSLFTMILKPAVTELTGSHDAASISSKGAIIGFCFLMGWTTGGMMFGILGDKLGRVKALTISILLYAVFTGLCGLCQTWEQLALCRFLTALGIGGELIVGTTLLAESWPEKYRARAVGVLTTAYQAGVSLVGVASLVLESFSWRYLFFLGALPAIMVMFVRRHVEEPERWKVLDNKRKAVEANTASEAHFRFTDLFAPHQWQNTMVAGTFTGAMLIAYWASTFWIPTWVHQLITDHNPVPEKSYLLLLQGVFAMVGSTSAGFFAEWLGRRNTVALAFLGYLLTSMGMFGLTTQFGPGVYVWGAAMGIFIGMSIGICYIYVPELFPTRLRATGTGFCFNIGRVAAAVGMIFSSDLVRLFGGLYAQAALTISYVLILGMLVVYWATETRGQLLKD